MALERLIHHAPSGSTLNVFLKEPETPVRAVVQINHGLAEHAARYQRFMEALATQGIASIAHDHRGHGTTRAPDAPLGRFAKEAGADAVIDDVLAVHGLILKRWPGRPVIIFGHSMGGLIALNFVLRHPDRVQAAAIWNANFSAGLLGRVAQAILAWEKFRLGSDVPSRLLPRLTFQAWGAELPSARTPFDWLSRDDMEVAKYIADPLCGWDASVSMWQDVFDFVFRGADDRNFRMVPRDLPFHLVGGADDPATDRGKAVQGLEARLRRMGFSNLETTIYAETRHESLNELNRNIMTADFVGWIDRIPLRTA
jgi:alpha-beta hydrolase superfamily lysophospholipase